MEEIPIQVPVYFAIMVVFVIAMYIQQKRYPHPDDETPVVLLVFPESYYEGALEPGETILFQAPAYRVPSAFDVFFLGGSGKNRPGEPCQLAYTSRGALLVAARGEFIQTLKAIDRYEHVHIERYKSYPWKGRPIPGQEPPYGELTLLLDGKRKYFEVVPEPFHRALRQALGE
ncbi:MAG: hypothetical protein DIU78_021370 [Pseudomonadota bacterium]|nr:MAG: hypothetical protein DIU78_10200 [Pseudomonadota bacterium]